MPVIPGQLYSQPVNSPNANAIGMGGYYPYRVAAGTVNGIFGPPPDQQRQVVFAQQGAGAQPSDAFDIAITNAETTARTFVDASGAGFTADEINAQSWAHIIHTTLVWSPNDNLWVVMVLFVISINDAQGNDTPGALPSYY